MELEPDELPAFLRRPDLGGVNITIPYKKTVLSLCDELDETVGLIGSANTLVRATDGKLRAYNTDAGGFSYLARRTGISFSGKNVVVLGSGGASLTVQAVARHAGARSVAVISRNGPDNYENLARHADAEIVINATPAGMYPHAGISPVDLREFPACRGVLDLIYNPRRTALLLQAEALGIPCSDGLPMLVKQAAEAEALFFGLTFPTEAVEKIIRSIRQEKTNLVLIGMPGCGKTMVGNLLAARTGRKAVDLDEEIVRRAGKSIPEIFAQNGETVFRRLEREMLDRWGQESSLILVTGGGAVLDSRNEPALRQNGRIYHIERELSRLARQGRPLSEGADLAAMYADRLPLYQRFRDLAVDNNGAAEDTADAIWRDFLAYSGTERPESESAGNSGA
jgi:shikimate dehydrogenase